MILLMYNIILSLFYVFLRKYKIIYIHNKKSLTFIQHDFIRFMQDCLLSKMQKLIQNIKPPYHSPSIQ